MDPPKRQRSHTLAANIQGLNMKLKRSSIPGSKDTNSINRTSLPPETPPAPANTPVGKSWMKLFSGHHIKPRSSTSSNNSSEFDLSYITPRLIALTTLRDHFSDVSTVESIHNLLNERHPDSYMIYSLDQTSFQKEFFHNRVVDLPLSNEKQSPHLIVLLWFCQKITLYLLESPLNVVVLHSIDEKNQLSFGACLLLAYHQIFARVEQIIHYYQSKRCTQTLLTMSQKRYIQYLCDLSFDVIERPHFNQLIIKEIDLTPVPLVNRQKTGCRPFVDIYDQEHNKIFSTYQETSKLKVYSSLDSNCIIPINLSFNGDLTIHITHATIGHSRQTHEGGIRICELTINSNFSTLNYPNLSYQRNELDGIDQNEKNPTLFRIKIEIIHPQNFILNKNDLFTEQLEKTLKKPLTLFGDETQFHFTVNDYENQFKINQSDDLNDKSDLLSSVIHRRRKSKDEPISPNLISPSQSISSFINPRHNTVKQQIEIKPTVVEENSNNEKTTVGNLLDFGEEDFNNEFMFERSFSSDRQQYELNSSFDSKINIFDEDSNSTKTNLQIISPSPITVTTIPKQEQKSFPTTPTTNAPTYNVNVETNNIPSSPLQSNPVRQTPSQKPRIDINQYFNDFGVLNKDHQSQPSVPTTIGAARKASLSKDIDPTVLKVRDWTEGKEKNLRALLCSLSSVIWPQCKWSGCQMNELVTDEQVKKAYRKAVLYIHPDKLRGDPNESLAKLIFVELNEAWSQFEMESKDTGTLQLTQKLEEQVLGFKHDLDQKYKIFLTQREQLLQRHQNDIQNLTLQLQKMEIRANEAEHRLTNENQSKNELINQSEKLNLLLKHLISIYVPLRRRYYQLVDSNRFIKQEFNRFNQIKQIFNSNNLIKNRFRIYVISIIAFKRFSSFKNNTSVTNIRSSNITLDKYLIVI